MHLINQLNEEQRMAVETLNGPLLVLAGAGSGKTRVVTYRIVNLLEHGIHPSSILGLTFTNKAAAEMKERVRHLTQHHVLICTFHSLGVRILREIIHVLGYKRDFTIYDEQDTEKLMKLCLEDMNIKTQKQDAKLYLNLISKAKNALQAPENIDSKLLDLEEKLFPDVYAHYQTKLKEYQAVDFDDLLYLPAHIFKTYPDILAHYQERWSHLLIDEYQDTNEAQYAIVSHLVSKHGNLCVVGDPDQSIYSWRGANIKNILNFEKDYPGAKVARLEQNYRSRTNILNGANALITQNSGRFEKNLWSDRGPGERIKHYTADTDRGEAGFVAEAVQYHHEHHDAPLSQMAVFYRTNAQSRSLEDRLLAHQIPYIIVGGISFYQRREIKDILAFLRMVHSGSDFVSFARTINLPKRGIGESTLVKIRLAATKENRSIFSYCEELVYGQALQYPIKLTAKQREGLKSYVDILRELKQIHLSNSLHDLVTGAIQCTGYLSYIKEDIETHDDRKENLNSLLAKAVEWELATEEPTLSGFLEELSLKSSLDEADTSKEKVHLMTIHNSKGLEFSIVFLVGLEEDLFPHANSRDSHAALEEERRLCYVGMTRAKDCLYLCDVRQRFLWGTTRSQRPSRFLREVPHEYIEKIRSSIPSRTAIKSQAYAHRKVDIESELSEVNEVQFIDDMDQTLPEYDEFKVDDAVFHKDFGLGIIRKSYTGSIGLIYKVYFAKDNSERSLVAKFAHLKKV
ncbi:MAG: UvrD-helicase domain-containing protein [Parachlamydiaceae bacterium]|nr:UvrD-helicase domain-containing protein [Parachlamydiaceae bacterium]